MTSGAASPSTGPISGLWRRWALSEDDLYAARVRAENHRPECVSCARLRPGMVARVAGRLTSVVIDPASTQPRLEAELFDGTATVTLRWLGRRRIAGIEPGRRLVVAARAARGDQDTIVMYNPWYEIVVDEDRG